jgi:hypothetical protein
VNRADVDWSALAGAAVALGRPTASATPVRSAERREIA